MSSKLDPFSKSIFQWLNGEGQSYRAVAGRLLEVGVEITPQSLHSWHTRKSKKIAARLAPVASPMAKPQAGKTRPQYAEPLDGNRPALAVSKRGKGHALSPNATPSLKSQIDTEIRLRASDPFSLAGAGFPARLRSRDSNDSQS